MLNLHDLNTTLPQVSPNIGTKGKITLPKGLNIELLFDSHHGIYNLRHVFDLAKQYGFAGEWVEGEDVECSEDAEQYLNNEVCKGCSVQWHEDVWIVRDGYNMETGEMDETE